MLGNAEIDGEAIGPNSDSVRGIGQLTEAIAFGYNKAVLVTTPKNRQENR